MASGNETARTRLMGYCGIKAVVYPQLFYLWVSRVQFNR